MEKLTELWNKFQLSNPDFAQMQADLNSENHHNLGTNSRLLDTLRRQLPDSRWNTFKTKTFNPSDPKTWETMTKAMEIPYPAPTALPCANVHPLKSIVCKNAGKRACSACRLVSYCAKECQTAHWKLHKQDCQNPMRSDGWQPGWAKEERSPSFIINDRPSPTNYFGVGAAKRLSDGPYLWGNTPAMDVINLLDNENDAEKDLSLAFVASGDLRYVLQSLNGLPSNYSGKLKILLNDIDLTIVCRNIVLLLIIGHVPDEAKAADIALHFWYSAFMPKEYYIEICVILASFIAELQESEEFSFRLGPRSMLYLCLPRESEFKEFLGHFFSFSTAFEDLQDEYRRVWTAPSWCDFRDRMYAGLKPSHRAAFEEYRRCGVLLPFGAVKSHFNRPNASLFTPEGKWRQSDLADPLQGWDVGSVITIGNQYGASTEDIYGCLYFFLSEQLRTFARRLRSITTTFTALRLDARLIPKEIQAGFLQNINLPCSIRFDRIVVSNIFDSNYVGIEDVLTTWAPLLANDTNATILGYFLNWPMLLEDGRISGANPEIEAALVAEAWKRSGTTLKDIKKIKSDPRNIIGFQFETFNAMSSAAALYENSGPFAKFLKAQGIDRILETTKLKMRERHRIVPQRFLTTVQGPANALPEFLDDEAWYNYTKLSSFTWVERFVEFERA